MNGRYTDPHTAADSVDKITGDDVVQAGWSNHIDVCIVNMGIVHLAC
jgi:hypothetical protein